MKFQIPTVYPITDRALSRLSHAEQVAELIAGGATIIQIREKHLSPREFLIEADAAMRLARERGVKIVINDRVDIGLVVNADGVHLGQDDLPPTAARKLLGDDAIIGYSTHDIEQAISAASQPIDYIAIGLVFPTKTKQNPDAVVGLESVRRVRDAIKELPLVAIGGITLDNAREVIAAGADSVAVISALFNSPSDVAANLRYLFSVLHR